jgi:hypothetical protein
MEKKQTKQHASNTLLVKEATNDPESLELVPSFRDGINRLGEINKEVNSLAVLQEKDLKGITTDKDKTKLTMSDWMIEVSGAVHSYAHGIGNNTLMSRVAYKRSEIRRMDQPELLAAAGVVLEEAQRIPAEALLKEGICPDDLISMQNLIADFNNVKSGPKEAVIDRSGATEKVRALFAEAKGIIENSLDKLAPQYKRKAPEFYRRYIAVRGKNKRGRKSTKTEPVVTPETPVVK